MQSLDGIRMNVVDSGRWSLFFFYNSVFFFFLSAGVVGHSLQDEVCLFFGLYHFLPLFFSQVVAY